MSGKASWFALIDEIGSSGLIPEQGEDGSVIASRPPFDPSVMKDGSAPEDVLDEGIRAKLSSDEVTGFLKEQSKVWSQIYRKQFILDVDGDEQFHETPMPIRPSGDQDRLERLVRMGDDQVEGVDFYDILFGGRRVDGAPQADTDSDGDADAVNSKRRVEAPTITQREQQEMDLRNMMLSNGTRQLNSMFTSAFRGAASNEAAPWKRPDFTPIILVSPLTNAPLQIFNVGMFLHNGRYEDPQRKWLNPVTGETNRVGRQQGVAVSPNAFLNTNKFQSAFRKFLVYDDISQLKPEQWAHVCAAIVSDDLWQFDGWFPTNSLINAEGFQGEKDSLTKPSVLFGNICGFLPYFEEDVQSPRLKEWRVKPVVLTRRAMKAGAHIRQATEFWEHLYNFLDTHPRFRHYCLPAE